MLSICIPVYNSEVEKLHYELTEAGKQFPFSYEIIIIDDASEKRYREKNAKLQSDKTKFIPLDKNIGRAAIRNLFVNYANYEYMLFLDCDSRLRDINFLKNYTDILEQKPEIVVGGSVYPNTPPPAKYRLHWKYGRKHEASSINKQKTPVLKTNNFIIRKYILKQIKFDERLKTYGHEDTLMGMRLKNQAFTIVAYDNPVINSKPDLNSVFLNKTNQAVDNLWYILSFVEDKELFINEVKLLRVYFKIKKTGLISLFYPVAIIKLKPIKYLLANGFNSVFLFNIYKLLKLVISKPQE